MAMAPVSETNVAPVRTVVIRRAFAAGYRLARAVLEPLGRLDGLDITTPRSENGTARRRRDWRVRLALAAIRPVGTHPVDLPSLVGPLGVGPLARLRSHRRRPYRWTAVRIALQAWGVFGSRPESGRVGPAALRSRRPRLPIRPERIHHHHLPNTRRLLRRLAQRPMPIRLPHQRWRPSNGSPGLSMRMTSQARMPPPGSRSCAQREVVRRGRRWGSDRAPTN